MDAIDRKILAVLQQDASHSVAEIGSLVGLSSTPCWKRIQRLEAEGVIQKRVALVDQDKIGLGVTVFVSIETGDHSPEWLDRFAREVGDMPEVMEQEPNNDPAKATRVNVPCGVSARFAEKGDVDHFVFAAKKGQRLIIDAHTHELNSPTEVYMVLKDAKGAQLAASNPMVISV